MDAADAVDHALQIYDFDDQRVLLSNHGTDAGGSFTTSPAASGMSVGACPSFCLDIP